MENPVTGNALRDGVLHGTPKGSRTHDLRFRNFARFVSSLSRLMRLRERSRIPLKYIVPQQIRMLRYTIPRFWNRWFSTEFSVYDNLNIIFPPCRKHAVLDLSRMLASMALICTGPSKGSSVGSARCGKEFRISALKT